MKILLVNQTFYPDESASAQYLTDLAEQLVDDGHNVNVITSARGYLSPSETYPAFESHNGISIHRIAPYPGNRAGKVGRILDGLWTNALLAWWLLRSSQFDVVIALTSPPLVAWVARFLGRRPKHRFIYWLLDLNPDQAFVAGWIKKDSFVGRVLERAFLQVIRGSDLIVTLDHLMAKRITERGIPASKVKIVPPWSDTQRLLPIAHEHNEFRRRIGAVGKLVVMYSGNFALCHPLETMLAAAAALKEDRTVQFVFIGNGVRAEEIVRFRDENQLNNIICLPYQPRSQLSQSLSAADLHIVSMGDSYRGIVHPSKLYGILAVGRPAAVICTDLTFLDPVIQESKALFHVTPRDSKGLVSIIRALKEDPARQLSIGTDARELSAHFARSTLARKISDLVDEPTNLRSEPRERIEAGL